MKLNVVKNNADKIRLNRGLSQKSLIQYCWIVWIHIKNKTADVVCSNIAYTSLMVPLNMDSVKSLKQRQSFLSFEEENEEHWIFNGLMKVIEHYSSIAFEHDGSAIQNM